MALENGMDNAVLLVDMGAIKKLKKEQGAQRQRRPSELVVQS